MTEPSLTPAELGALRKISRATVTRLSIEGMPHIVISIGPGGRVTRRFRLAAVDGWLTERSERLVNDWRRYRRRGAA